MKIARKDILLFSFVAIPFIGLMVAWLGFGERGFIHLYKMEQERQAYMERIMGLEEENMKLLEEINRLKTDRAYMEAVARRELGLIKDDEILFRFSADKEGSDKNQKKTGQAQAETEKPKAGGR